MQDAVLIVKKLGVPPEGFVNCDKDYDEETYQLWEDWIDAVCEIKCPITWEEAEILIRCCPTEHMAGVEWSMLHCIESVFKPEAIEQYRDLIEKCNSDMMKQELLRRLKN